MKLAQITERVLGYLALNMCGEAIEELRSLSPEEQRAPEIVELSMEIFRRQQRWKAMRELAQLMVDAHPMEIRWRVDLAYAVRRHESIAAARAVLQLALQQDNTEPVVHFNLGCYACQEGDYEGAMLHLKHALKLDSRYLEIAMADGDLRPLWPRIQSELAPKLLTGPEPTELDLVRALQEENEEVVGHAFLSLWEHWMNEGGPMERRLMDRGIALIDQGDLATAEGLFQRMANRNPDWAEPMNKLATVLYLQKRYRDSVHMCLEVVRLKPHHIGAWQGIGLCARALNDQELLKKAAAELARWHPHSVIKKVK